MGVYKVKLPIRGSVVKRLLIIVPVVVLGLTLVSLFMPARRVSIEGVGKVSFETTVTLSVGSEVAYASPDTATNPPTANAGSAWTNPTNAYTDGGSATTITSGAPSGNNIWGTYGFNLTGNLITQVRVRYDAWSAAPAMPVYRGAGAKAAGTGAVTPALPGTIASNDIAILCATTIAGGTVTITANGSISSWTALTGSPIDVASGEKLYVWWGRYSSGSTGPTVTPGSNHCCAGVAAWYNCITSGSPIDVSATGTEATSDVSLSFATGISTTVNNCMVILVSSTGYDSNTAQHSAQANANLSSIAERMDYNTSSGGGGGFECVQGGLATTGAIGTWTATLATASPKAYISFALKPDTAYEQIRVDVSWNGGTNWSSQQTGLSGSETTYWYDVTAATTWTPEKLSDSNLKVRADANTVGVASVVSLDWLPVEVTYTVPNISNTPDSKGFGPVAESSNYWSKGSAPTFPLDDGECYFTLTNSGAITININIKATNFTGGSPGWTLSDAVGENIVVLKAGKSGDTLETNMVILTTSDQSFITGLLASGTKMWEIKLETGTFTNGDPKSSTITLTAVAQ